MGIAQAGIAFRITQTVKDLESFLSDVFEEPATELPLPVSERFDIRNHCDVMLQTFGDVWFISNDDLAWPLIRRPQADTARLHGVLGRPPLAMAFCHYDASRSHGYAVFERGVRRRYRLQTGSTPDTETLVESGAPLPFEQRWLAAAQAVESGGAVAYLGEREVVVPARDLTGRMLHDGLEALFGVCPWETLMTPTYRFFRLGPDRSRAEPPAPPSPAPAAPRRPWWRFV